MSPLFIAQILSLLGMSLTAPPDLATDIERIEVIAGAKDLLLPCRSKDWKPCFQKTSLSLILSVWICYLRRKRGNQSAGWRTLTIAVWLTSRNFRDLEILSSGEKEQNSKKTCSMFQLWVFKSVPLYNFVFHFFSCAKRWNDKPVLLEHIFVCVKYSGTLFAALFLLSNIFWQT